MPNYYCDNFPPDQLYQAKTLSAGEKATVFVLTVPPNYYGFLERIANRWYPDTLLEWRIDGKLIERVVREIAPLNQEPYYCRPAYLVHMKIEWIGQNDSATSKELAVFCDGRFCRTVRNRH